MTEPTNTHLLSLIESNSTRINRLNQAVFNPDVHIPGARSLIECVEDLERENRMLGDRIGKVNNRIIWGFVSLGALQLVATTTMVLINILGG